MTDVSTPRPKVYHELTPDEHCARYTPLFPEGKKWQTMTDAEKQDWRERADYLGEKKIYDAGRSWAGEWETTPEWEDLTAEQRTAFTEERIREAQDVRAARLASHDEVAPKV